MVRPLNGTGVGTGEEEDAPELTAEECIRAGMYWFGRSDFAAADAWWQRALEIDPDNTRAKECLRLLSKSSPTGLDPVDMSDPEIARYATHDLDIQDEVGFGPESSSDNVAVLMAGDDDEPSGPMEAASVSRPPAMVLDPSGDLRTDVQEEAAGSGSRDLPPTSNGPQGRGFPFYDDPDPQTPPTTDPFDFAATGQNAHNSSPPRPMPAVSPTATTKGGYASPWDDGPSRTSVLTIDAEDQGYDAVPDPTPLPAIDRKRFFRREEPQTPEEILDFLRATGDLGPSSPPSSASTDRGTGRSATAAEDPGSGRMRTGSGDAEDRRTPARGADEGILFDDPVEFEAPTLSGVDNPVAAGRPAEPMVSVPAGPSPELSSSPQALLEDGRRRYQLHDFDGAIEVLSAIPTEAAEVEEARNLVASSRSQLLRMYESKIGDFGRTPRVLISNEQIIWLNLNHRAGFILSQIDGAVTYEDIVSLSGMPRLDTVRILSQLLSDKVIGVD